MEWYYAEGQNQIGPISDSEFRNLVKNGTILSDTLVWNSGMTDWKTYGKLVTSSAAASNKSSPPDESSPLEDTPPHKDPPPSEVPSTPPEAPKLQCSECGGAFPADDMIRYENSLICSACKPIFMQKIKQGAEVSPPVEAAGFWSRLKKSLSGKGKSS